MRQLPHRAVHNEMLIVEASFTSTARSTKQSQVIAGIVATVSDPLAHEDRALPQEKARDVICGVFQGRIDFVDKLWCQPFVGIQVEDPRRVELQIVKRPVPLISVVLERVLYDTRSLGGSDLYRAVCATRINDEQP